MHRFFIARDSFQKDRVRFSAGQSHQLRDVLRMREGEQVLALDNLGFEYVVNLDHIARDGVWGQVLEKRAAIGEPKTTLILYQALLKADKFEWVLQKGTELGISGFVPLLTERSLPEAGKTKIARWSQIVAEAAEQSGRGKIPLLAPHQSLQDSLHLAQTHGGTVLLAWEQAKDSDLQTALKTQQGNPIHLFIGPEGGYSEQEAALARDHNAQIVTLGPRIFRAETAGLVAATAIFFARGDLGCS